jgi:hypothetical protein
MVASAEPPESSGRAGVTNAAKQSHDLDGADTAAAVDKRSRASSGSADTPARTRAGLEPTFLSIALLANLAHRRGLDLSVERTVGPEDPLSVGDV